LNGSGPGDKMLGGQGISTWKIF